MPQSTGLEAVFTISIFGEGPVSCLHIFLVFVKEVGELRLYPTNLLPRRGGSVTLFGDVEDDGQSSAHDQIWRNGIGAARQEEALDAGYGKTSMLAHPEDSNTLTLRWGRRPVDV